jgi:hypothetical protein
MEGQPEPAAVDQAGIVSGLRGGGDDAEVTASHVAERSKNASPAGQR